MNVSFIDLHTQYISIKKEIDEAVQKIIDSGRFEQGDEVLKFEKEFADFLNAKYCISLNSGTDALILGIRALNLSPGDEVILPSYTFIATAIAAVENGLKPVFADIDEKDYGINLHDLKSKINNRTKVIILVHLYGQPDKIDEVKSIIKKSGKKIYLVEDACQAHGAEYKNRKVGNFGIFSTFSFYPTKNLGAYGDGGVIVTNNKKLASKYRLLKQYGQEKKYYSKSEGINSRLDTIQAAILRVKLKYLDMWNKKRRLLANIYTKMLNKKAPDIQTPKEYKKRKSVYHLYVVRAKKRNALMNNLKHKNINCLIHYPVPLHLQEVYRNFGYKKGDLPVVEKIASEVMSLPFYAEMPKKSISKVVNSISEFYRS